MVLHESDHTMRLLRHPLSDECFDNSMNAGPDKVRKRILVLKFVMIPESTLQSMI